MAHRYTVAHTLKARVTCPQGAPVASRHVDWSCGISLPGARFLSNIATELDRGNIVRNARGELELAEAIVLPVAIAEPMEHMVEVEVTDHRPLPVNAGKVGAPSEMHPKAPTRRRTRGTRAGRRVKLAEAAAALATAATATAA